MTDSVSIIVPTRNREALLREALRSVRRQTWPHLETVVVDDASTDSTGEMLAAEFPGIRVVRNGSARGPARARNSGIDAATGQWVLFLDDDDLLHPEHVEALVHAAADLPVEEIVSGRWRRFGIIEGQVRLGPVICAAPRRSASETLAEILEPMGESTICGHSVLWPRELLRTLRWDDTLTANGDSDLFGRAILAGHRIVGRDVGMAYYRHHDEQRVSSITALSRPLSAARYRLKWSDLLLARSDREHYAVAMRNGFMTLLIALAGLPEGRAILPDVEKAFTRWGGGAYFIVNPPKHPLKRYLATATLRLGGPTALHWLLKQASQPARLAKSDRSTFRQVLSERDSLDAAVIESLL